MRAKARSDLTGLFADLPDVEEPGKAVHHQNVRPGDGRPRHRIAGLILIIVMAAVLGHVLEVSSIPFFFWHALAQSFIPWLLIGLLIFPWKRYGPGRRHRP